MTSVELKELNPGEADTLRAISHYKRYTKNESVFREGDKYTGPYLVVEGQFKIFLLGDDGKEAIMHIFRTGEMIAGGPLFLGGNYPAYCASLSDGCLAGFEYDRLKKLIAEEKAIHSFFVERSVRLIPRLKEKIENLTLKDAEGRICAYLKSLGADQAPVELDIPKNQIAALLNLTPESVSRVFAQLVTRGVITVLDNRYQLAK